MRGSRYKHVGSRFQQPRTLPDACQSWLRSKEEEGDSGSVHVSDLPENVTQQRLYKSRLFDLAKERHKVMLESDFTRNQFIDHQVRKSKTLDRLLMGFDIEQYRNKSASVVEKLHQKSMHTKLMILATRKLGMTIEETRQFTEEELRQKLNISPADDVDAEKELGASFSRQRPVTSRTQSCSQLNLLAADGGRPSSVGQAVRLPRVDPRRQSAYRQSFAAGLGRSPSTPAARPRTASARRRVQNDPRCLELINTLTPRYRTSTKFDVDAIIRSNASLSQPTSARSDQSQKTAAPRTRRQAMEMLDSIVKSRYYETSNLATLS